MMENEVHVARPSSAKPALQTQARCAATALPHSFRGQALTGSTVVCGARGRLGTQARSFLSWPAVHREGRRAHAGNHRLWGGMSDGAAGV